ncbi:MULTISPECIES: aldehyde dehydrogenase family protein [unclassified Vibrio]|uniref:Aldehyde dehydrogenase family protein n=1 Tax=Vibrio sp. HB236076 TaxID=3232307 RepID=A0AB39HL79_9VIBR|nr:aldehyde dehydrogenase family protein [Vibrio sp. HB161653]MDP5252566.1 aldehyde dehydrogenase family protein [Vibrio sp. HB161653]
MLLANIQPQAIDGKHLFYDGCFQPVSSPQYRDILCPATNKEIGKMAIASSTDVEKAVFAAQQAFYPWSALDPMERGRYLRKLADIIADNMESLAAWESRLTGRPIREMKAQMSRIPEWLEYFSGIALGLEGESNVLKGGLQASTAYEPYGVCALLTPWNHPILILVKKMAAALAAGNTVVIKPSELAPSTSLVLAYWCALAGFPRGVVNVVTGEAETGAALCASESVRRIDLTGGTETGKRVAAAAAERLVPCTLELGGKTPVVIFGDTNIDQAAAGAVFAAFVASGQTCVSASRFIVHQSVYEPFLAALKQRTEQLKLGCSSNLTTDVGPVISSASRRRCEQFIEQAKTQGARLISGAKHAELEGDLAQGNFVTPTIFADVTPAMTLFREEVFGPVIAVTPFEDEQHALQLANDTPFSLGASIWTRDIALAHRMGRRIKAGMIWINDHHKNDPRSIWSGSGESGYGVENGWDALKAYCIKRNVVVSCNPTFDDWFAGGSRYG